MKLQTTRWKKTNQDYLGFSQPAFKFGGSYIAYLSIAAARWILSSLVFSKQNPPLAVDYPSSLLMVPFRSSDISTTSGPVFSVWVISDFYLLHSVYKPLANHANIWNYNQNGIILHHLQKCLAYPSHNYLWCDNFSHFLTIFHDYVPTTKSVSPWKMSWYKVFYFDNASKQ